MGTRWLQEEDALIHKHDGETQISRLWPSKSNCIDLVRDFSNLKLFGVSGGGFGADLSQVGSYAT
jgi:hypothetical protein